MPCQLSVERAAFRTFRLRDLLAFLLDIGLTIEVPFKQICFRIGGTQRRKALTSEAEN